jgi:hypothetical protein
MVYIGGIANVLIGAEMALLSISNDAKTIKGQKRGYLTGILYLAPHKLSGRNLCPNASPGCIATCLNTAGRGAFNSVQRARIAKTHRFTAYTENFMRELYNNIGALRRKAARKRMTPLVRLNGTSDIPWENVKFDAIGCGPNAMIKLTGNMMEYFPDIQFYDYTKSPNRMYKFLRGELPKNYHLTFSRSECNNTISQQILSDGGNVAVVFSTKRGDALPEFWNGFMTVDGDIDDVRHTDQGIPFQNTGLVIGLRAKGKARHDKTGFVVNV